MTVSLSFLAEAASAANKPTMMVSGTHQSSDMLCNMLVIQYLYLQDLDYSIKYAISFKITFASSARLLLEHLHHRLDRLA